MEKVFGNQKFVVALLKRLTQGSKNGAESRLCPGRVLERGENRVDPEKENVKTLYLVFWNV